MTVSLHILKLFSSKEVEARVIFLTTKKVKDRGFFQTYVVSYVKEVINAIKRAMDWSIKSIFLDIMDCASYFRDIFFHHIHF